MSDSRQFVPELVAVARREGDRTQLLAPSPGWWREMPSDGALVRGGESIGALEILGVQHRLRAPDGVIGVVVAEAQDGLTRRPVDHGALLLTLDPEALGGVAATQAAAVGEAATGAEALLVRAPSSGRFYRRPAPDKPAFVEVGQVLSRGQTIGVLEVMKTFTRINYDDPRLPAPARVVEILAADQADLGSGDPLLRIEPVEA